MRGAGLFFTNVLYDRSLKIAVVLFYPKAEPIAIVLVFTVNSVTYICGNCRITITIAKAHFKNEMCL